MTKNYQFTDEQIARILSIIRWYADNGNRVGDKELANLIEDQITNHPEND
jgi:plasmid stabilization system protein ParE